MRRPSVVEAWGSSAEERVASYPCDALIDEPDGVVFRAVEIAAPAELVFRWLCQLRVAPYSYDLIDNLGRRSPRHIIDGLDQLNVGQRFMVMFRLAAFETDRSITLDSRTAAFGRVAGTYLVVPIGTARSRLVVKLAYVAPGGPYAWWLKQVLPAADLFMMRKQLLTLKRLVEHDAQREPTA
ncbi:MAG TPA: hypothetical protein VIX84_20305 [Acidimicrobiales bacterium]